MGTKCSTYRCCITKTPESSLPQPATTSTQSITQRQVLQITQPETLRTSIKASCTTQQVPNHTKPKNLKVDTMKKWVNPDDIIIKLDPVISSHNQATKPSTESKITRSLSAVRLNKEDVTPHLTKRSAMSSFVKRTITGKYFDTSKGELPIIHSLQRKQTLKFRNSTFLNEFLIEKLHLRVNFEQIPKKEGDSSIDNPNSQRIIPAETIQIEVIKRVTEETHENPENHEIQSPSALKFYFRPAFLNELLLNIYELNTANLKKYELIHEEKTQPHKMKIYCTNYTTTEKNKVNIFRTEFFVPCHPVFFLQFMNNIAEQTKMDLLLDKYYIAEAFTEKTNVIYLSYKKTIISSARDFIYLKNWGQIEKNGVTYYCDTSRSIVHDEYPTIKNIVRGDIIYSGHVVTLVKDSNGNDGSFCRMYSECDFKVNVPGWISKKFSKDEMKAYTERCIARIKELQRIGGV